MIVHRGVRRPVGKLVAVVGVLALAGCASAEQAPCTAIGAPVGIGVDVDAAVAQHVTNDATLRVSWGSTNIETALTLSASTEAVDQGCSGEDESSVCSATASPTGAKTGFADVPELPDEPVDVALVLTELDGEPRVLDGVQVTPAATYPNGPHCPAGGNQAQLTVNSNGEVQPR